MADTSQTTKAQVILESYKDVIAEMIRKMDLFAKEQGGYLNRDRSKEALLRGNMSERIQKLLTA